VPGRVRFRSDAGASFAGVLVTGSPFVRITEARQEKVKVVAFWWSAKPCRR
jgi:hypothetical protein